MCGIVGIYDFRCPVDQGELDAFTDSLTHRGPDGRGTFVDGNLGLGHRRLSILDLSDAGKNPMSYRFQDGTTLWITFNGEIYNFLELRRELQVKGYVFHTDTDTEVILVAYKEWGENSLFKFNGMWAFAIWDTQKRVLFLSRDRFGVKPLYFSLRDGCFYFASELKSFTFLRRFSPCINHDMLPDILRSPSQFEGMSNSTILKNVYKLPPGYNLIARRDQTVSQYKWWETAEHIPMPPTSYAEQVDAFRELLLDAVRLRMRSDVRLGTSLSGGVDSSAVACAMQLVSESSVSLERWRDDWRSVFIASFPNTVLDETAYAQVVARRIGAASYLWEYSSNIKPEDLISSVYFADDIIATSLMPMMSIYRTMRNNGVRVSLDGHGADELLCGYTLFFGEPRRTLRDTLYRFFHQNILPSILKNFDRASMASGVEVRSPFLDYRLVTYCFGLPIESIIGKGYTKRILRDALVAILPESILRRQSKIGFKSPLGPLFNNQLNDLLLNLSSAYEWNELPLGTNQQKMAIKELTMQRRWTESASDQQLAIKAWKMVNYLIWHKLFIDKTYLYMVNI